MAAAVQPRLGGILVVLLAGLSVLFLGLAVMDRSLDHGPPQPRPSASAPSSIESRLMVLQQSERKGVSPQDLQRLAAAYDTLEAEHRRRWAAQLEERKREEHAKLKKKEVPAQHHNPNGDQRYFEVVSQRDYVAQETLKASEADRALLRRMDDVGAAAKEVWARPDAAKGITATNAVAGIYHHLKEGDAVGVPLQCLRSHRVHPGCPSVGEVPLLITGVGRSGTLYMNHQFQARGFSFMHEAVQADGSASWTYGLVDPDWYYPWEASGMRIGRKRFRKLFHQVRHPLDSIASLTTFADKSWRFIAKNTVQVPDFADLGSPEHKALIHWVTWNRMIEAEADWRYRVEDTPFEVVCLRAGYPAERCQKARSGQPDVHQRQHQLMTWDSLMKLDPAYAAEARAMAVRYGYENAAVADAIPDQRQEVNFYEG